MSNIKIIGARTHNLKNVSVEIPKNKLTVITGLSGSGKSSLAFDTIFAEGQRRYIESLSSYVRQFLSEIEKPDFDYIEGLSPAIAIDQKTSARNPRSTVATATEIYDFLRLLFARVGTPFCPNCQIEAKQQKIDTIAQLIIENFSKADVLKVKIYAPIIRGRKGEHKYELKQAKKQQIVKVRLDGTEMDIDELLALDFNKQANHDIDLLVGSVDFPISNDQSKEIARIDLLKLLQKALNLANGMVLAQFEDTERYYSQKYACSQCGWQFPDIDPRLFSFNNPQGACDTCQGLGIEMTANPELVLPNPRLTLAEGAIRPWSRTTSNSSWQKKALEDLSAKYNFSLDTPFANLDYKVKNIVLSGEEITEENAFEGVLPNLERRYRETDSDYLKNEIEKYLVEKICRKCNGQRLRQDVLSIKINGLNIIDTVSMNIDEAKKFFSALKEDENIKHRNIASIILKEIVLRVGYLEEVGLGYLTLDRPTSTLAGGEAQRVRLSTQLSSGLTGVVYILDEPSIGLHPRDHDKMLKTISDLRDRGNTVIVVEHDRETMEVADYIIDMGPGAGEQGGHVMAKGTYEEICEDDKSLTGQYLSGKKIVNLPTKNTAKPTEKITISGATGNNLKDVTVDIPLNRLVCITGVSGSGKSTLVCDTLAIAIEKHFGKNQAEPAPYKTITGLENADNIINIDQSPIGRTPRSNTATYTGALGPIRDLFAQTDDAQKRGYDPARFSFNLRGGRCENCRGDGQIKMEMNFLPDVYVPCDECHGSRYNNETLEIKYRSKNISEVLNLTVTEALEFFKGNSDIEHILTILKSVGLGYMALGQPATTLSGGEAQRIKLATELSKKETGKTIYILDEPSTGLHFEDIQHLLKVLSELVSRGNTVIIIEHNLDIVKCADWVIDMGPEGGDKGGEVVATGTPEDIAKNPASHTGHFLKNYVD